MFYYYTDADNKRRKHKLGMFDPTGVDGYWLERAIAEVEELRVNFRKGVDPRTARIKDKKQSSFNTAKFFRPGILPIHRNSAPRI